MIQESGEMYLETILLLSRKKPDLHAIDISDEMNFSKPSISRALGRLKSEGCIDVDPKGTITLTASGKACAEDIYARHQLFTRILQAIGVSEETASRDACRIEHYISSETVEAVKRYAAARGLN